jgi:hypothetical protein
MGALGGVGAVCGLAADLSGARTPIVDPIAVKPRVDRERKSRLDVGIAFDLEV